MPGPLAAYESEFARLRSETPFRDFLFEIASWQPITLYRGAAGVSRYPETGRFRNVVTCEEFGKLRDGLVRKTRSAEAGKPLWEAVGELLRDTPAPALFGKHAGENSQYSDCCGNSKNAYLSMLAVNCENVVHSFSAKSSTDLYDSAAAMDECQNVYRSSGVSNGSNIFFSRYVESSRDLWFCRNMVGCQECLFCDGLQNASYHINNVPLGREEYFARKAQMLARRHEFEEWYRRMPRDPALPPSALRCSGTFVSLCEDVENGHWTYNVKNGRNVIFTGGKSGKYRLYDTVTCGAAGDMYATLNGVYFSERVYGCVSVIGCHETFSSFNLESCTRCVGCVGLINKSNCIYNEQYSAEEWDRLAPAVLEDAKRRGEFGKFFPARMNPFYFNDTLASFVDASFTREEALAAGFLWRDEPIRADVPEGAETVRAQDLGAFESERDGAWKIDRAVCSKVVVDAAGNSYRVTKLEADFLERNGLPLPRTHWSDRMRQALASK